MKRYNLYTQYTAYNWLGKFKTKQYGTWEFQNSLNVGSEAIACWYFNTLQKEKLLWYAEKYSWTSLERPPWGQKKVATVESEPLQIWWLKKRVNVWTNRQKSGHCKEVAIGGGSTELNFIKWITYFFLQFNYSVRCCQTCSLSLACVANVERGGKRTGKGVGIGERRKTTSVSLFSLSHFSPPLLPSLLFIFWRLPRRLSVVLACLRWNKLTRTTTYERKWK